MAKKGKKTETTKVVACLNCGATVKEGETYCQAQCEIDHLRKQMAEKDEKLSRFARRKEPPQCYARVEWLTCTQEWYTKASFDAKRRTQELRKLGFECAAQSVGKMPVVDGSGEVVAVKMTVVTCAFRQEDDGTEVRPPEPQVMVGGLQLPIV